MKIEFKPCPFCGGTDLEPQRGTTDREGTPTNITCVDCGATGPWVYEKSPRGFLEALEAWNDRN